jgi:hypothetical protein
MQVSKPVAVIASDKLMKINGWTWLRKDTGGWKVALICYKTSKATNSYHEWIELNNREYVLHGYKYDFNDESAPEIIAHADCLADVIKYIVDN